MSDYAVVRATDAPDFTEGKKPGEAFLGYGGLDSEQVSINVVTLEPGTTHGVPGMSEDIGHSHEDIDEIYVVVAGTVTVKADDEEIELGPLDAMRFAPSVKRATRNAGSDTATVIMFSPKMTDPRAQSHFHEGFWE
jgi:mannose-6-phosphate isomerase-like protein (cupin superfamily)